MVTANLLIWWIDSTGILHSCAHIATPPTPHPTAPHYAQGQINPATHTGSITHIHNTPASLPITPRELFDVLNARFPHTRWWIPNHTHAPTQTNTPVPAHF